MLILIILIILSKIQEKNSQLKSSKITNFAWKIIECPSDPKIYFFLEISCSWKGS